MKYKVVWDSHGKDTIDGVSFNAMKILDNHKSFDTIENARKYAREEELLMKRNFSEADELTYEIVSCYEGEPKYQL